MTGKASGGIPRDLKKLWSAVFFMFLGFGIYNACAPNFLTEVLKISPMSIGFVEAVRELPGFLCVFVAALTMQIAEPILGAVAMTLLAIGIGAYATVHGIPSLLVWSFVWSIGMHTWMPLSSSLTLNLSDPSSRGRRIGQTVGFGAVGSVIGMLAVSLVAHRLHYQTWFVTAGALVAVGALTMLSLRRDIGHMDKPKLVWKPRYRRYYLLSMLEGGRKQVFFTFAVYTLTKVYHASLQLMAALMLINGVVNLIGAPIVGRLIDRIRERRILMTSYSCVIGVFAIYGTAHLFPRWFGMPKSDILPVLCTMYCLDNLLYLSTSCLTTYLHRIAEPEDLMPTLSMGVTMNHVFAVLVPLIGAWLWYRFSYPIMFVAGGVVVMLSLTVVSGMKAGKPAESGA